MSDKYVYDVELSKVDEQNPVAQRLSPQIREMSRQLYSELQEAHNKYARAVGAMREAQPDGAANALVDQLGYENSLLAVGQLFADLLIDGTTPAYSMAFFANMLGQVAEHRAREDAQRKVGEFFENIATQAAAAKNPNN